VADFAVGKDVDDVLNLCLPLAVRFVLERSQDYRLFGNYYSIKCLLRAKQDYSLKVGFSSVMIDVVPGKRNFRKLRPATE
jgi:hypothetical protein